MCVRLDSYESPAHQQYVRTFLDGRFENSVFCMLEPDGQKWLTRAHRGPEFVLGRGNATSELQKFAKAFPTKAKLSEAIVPDFHSFRQALNVASADQRVLMLVNASADQDKKLRDSLRAVANDERVIGRFHFDFEQGDKWTKNIEGATESPGIFLIEPGEFGMSGKVMANLPLTAATAEIVSAMQKANKTFASTNAKKVYSDHVSKGRSQGIYFEGAVPYGEDRDGDGEIDRGGSRPGGRRAR